MFDDPTLETALQSLATASSEASDFWHRYETMKTHIAKNYYDWIQSEVPYLTDHGKLHIDCVIQTARAILHMLYSKERGFSGDPSTRWGSRIQTI